MRELCRAPARTLRRQSRRRQRAGTHDAKWLALKDSLEVSGLPEKASGDPGFGLTPSRLRRLPASITPRKALSMTAAGTGAGGRPAGRAPGRGRLAAPFSPLTGSLPRTA